MKAYFKLFRWTNLLIIILLQYLLKTAVFERFFLSQGLIFPDVDIWFALLVASTVFVAIAGYLANDIADLEIDKINRPARVLVTGEVSIPQARNLQWVFEILGVALGLSVAIYVGYYSLITFHLLVIIAMRAYSSGVKCKGIWGNLLVAFSAAAVPALVWVFAIFVLKKQTTSIDIDFSLINLIFLFYIGFAFIFTLIREYVKDLEDLKGDRHCGCKTMASILALQKSKNLVIVFNALAIQGILLFMWLLFNRLPEGDIIVKGETLFAANFSSIIIVVLIYIIPKLIKANSSNDFHKIGNMLKIVMIAGILQMVFLLL